MAQPITLIRKHLPDEQELQQESLEQVISDIAEHGKAMQETIHLLHELHKSGLLEAATALLEAKETIAKIAVGQLSKPNVTNILNHLLGAADGLGQIDPATTKKVVQGLARGLERAGEHVDDDKKMGMFDFWKYLRDPDINRAIAFGLHLLKGLGEGLETKIRL
ncbi:DUF1641 domain-containing protein [Fodinisporobacter ferrooxydans]|uniref:DUF1641 domain-containing protein n=1 Tax=Fodinisporobacter ferrooxydans TaxID=2901836 RepID=A0ABY4CL02_9BACL|nr:DUF1641 domain-containing protein [Alicyclobacillaceae bacterium MYW30-H2]